MATTYRQNLSRFDEIELGDSVTYRTHWTSREKTRAEREACKGGPYSTEAYRYVPMLDESRWYYPSGKVTEKVGDGWKVHGTIVTRESFWGLRKAPGKGNADARRFSPDDAVVACQVCGLMRNGWIGNTGKLPHHGYERPGWGEQTESCPGALQFAYAVVQDPKRRVKRIGRDVLPGVIAAYDDQIAATEVYLERVSAGTIDLPSEWRYRHDAYFPEDPKDPKFAPVPPTEQSRYAARQTRVRRDTEQRLVSLRYGRAEMQQRFDTWAPGGEGVLEAPAPR